MFFRLSNKYFLINYKLFPWCESLDSLWLSNKYLFFCHLRTIRWLKFRWRLSKNPISDYVAEVSRSRTMMMFNQMIFILLVGMLLFDEYVKTSTVKAKISTVQETSTMKAKISTVPDTVSVKSQTMSSVRAVEATDVTATSTVKAVEATDVTATSTVKAVEATDVTATSTVKAVEATDVTAEGITGTTTEKSRHI